jgi:uncharacterized protein YqeY
VVSEQQVAGDLASAMKARDMPRVYVLRGLLTAIKHRTVEKRQAALTEEELVQLVRREIRQREEAESFARQAGREDLVTQNQAERALLEAYLPSQLGVAELEAAVREIAAGPGGGSLGAIMGALRERFAGRYDGRQASEVARRILADVSRS